MTGYKRNRIFVFDKYFTIFKNDVKRTDLETDLPPAINDPFQEREIPVEMPGFFVLYCLVIIVPFVPIVGTQCIVSLQWEQSIIITPHFPPYLKSVQAILLSLLL